VEVSGHRVIQRREASLADLAFGEGALSVGWPGVDQQALFAPALLPPEAEDLVVASLGSDGSGYFGRVFLSASADLQAPITLQHAPVPGAGGAQEGATIFFRITDDRAGVDRTKLKLLVNGTPVAPRVRGVPRNLLVSYTLPPGLGSLATIRIEAADLAVPSHVMTPFEYDLALGPGDAPRFERGDVNADKLVDIADAVKILLLLFAGGPPSQCADAADTNDDDALNVSDAIYLLAYLFVRGNAPPPPGVACGLDPTPDRLGCSTQSDCN
jgi:hypothetical protein